MLCYVMLSPTKISQPSSTQQLSVSPLRSPKSSPEKVFPGKPTSPIFTQSAPPVHTTSADSESPSHSNRVDVGANPVEIQNRGVFMTRDTGPAVSRNSKS